MGIRGGGAPFYIQSSSMRTMTSTVLDVVDSSGGRSFARRQGSHNSIYMLKSLKTFASDV